MKILVTGGAGFIGRWVVKHLLERGYSVWVVDNLFSGKVENIAEFTENSQFKFIKGDILDENLLEELFNLSFKICLHLAALVNVQYSIDNPERSFEVNLRGTFNILEEAKKKNTRVILMSTCMVYKKTRNNEPINESHPLFPLSPYAATKIAAEELTLSYYHAYGLPVAILRPFNTYGPFQKTDNEGGVVPIFITRSLQGKTLYIYGDGTQTRDFLYVEDCAEAVIKTALSDKVWGEIINIGTGEDISINELATLIAGRDNHVRHIPHIHPQSEISKLICNYGKAKRLLNWEPKTSLREGIDKTREWVRKRLKKCKKERYFYPMDING